MTASLLAIKDMSKNFGGLSAVADLNMEVGEGQILGLIGPNGAGKTTTFNLITGFQIPTKGEIIFLGEPIAGLKPYEICRRGMTRTFQQAKPMLGMTILGNVIVGALNRVGTLKEAMSFSKEVLNMLGLAKFQDVLAENLPIGYRKVLELAKCLATQPRLLLLDEVIAGLNPGEVSLDPGENQGHPRSGDRHFTHRTCDGSRDECFRPGGGAQLWPKDFRGKAR